MIHVLFKLLLLLYTVIAVNGIAPSYSKELGVPYEPAKSLCFQGIGQLTVLRIKEDGGCAYFHFRALSVV